MYQSAPVSDEQIKRTRSQYAEALLELDGKPFSLAQYPMYNAIYDGQYQKTVLLTCRQVAKSTTLSNFSIIDSVSTPFFKTFFVAPTQEQTHKFSVGRVGKTIEYSRKIKEHFVNTETSSRVMSRMFANGSEINFSYALDDADRCRGNSADRVLFDEVQDILLDVVVPVVKECMANSEYQYENYCGTPKTLENGLEGIWQTSSQTEWVMKCVGCNTHNMIRTEKSLGKEGPICLKCGKCLDTRKGVWVDMNRDPNIEIKGFHISRPIMPRNVPACWPEGERKEKAKMLWKEVLSKMEGPNAYSVSMFRNEVLGVSDSQGRRIITEADIRSACDGPMIAPKPSNLALQSVVAMGAGVDWSGGGTKNLSRTVLWILGKIAHSPRIRTMWYKIYPGMNPVEEAMDIANTLKMFPNLGIVACDAGEGNANTDLLRKYYKPDPRIVVKIRYGSNPKYAQWDNEGCYYNVNRSAAIDASMYAMSRKEIQFPKCEKGGVMDVPIQDILNEYEEVTNSGYKVWRHAPTKPDDCLQALTFARLALQITTGEINLSAGGPNK